MPQAPSLTYACCALDGETLSFTTAQCVQAIGYDGQARRAVAHVTPPERLIAPGLLPTARYLGLLRDGSREAKLHPKHVEWLAQLNGVDNKDRGNAYYTNILDGSKMQSWPKTQGLGSDRQKSGKRARGSDRERSGRSGPGVERGRKGQLEAATMQ
jgi:hypothetical protein